MKSISKLKDDARRCEQQEQWEKAIAAYLQVLRISEAGEAEMELPLYNRVGDLYIRLGRPDDAVNYYEQAAERYAEIGLFNNAMALCNKALRYRPERLEVIRRLAQYSLQQGFVTDAMQYYLSYAEKHFSRGQHDEGLSALEEFANTSNDADARELYARRLQSLGRTQQAVGQLRQAHAQRVESGETMAATALVDEIRGLDPDAATALEQGQGPEERMSFDAEIAASAETEEPAHFGTVEPATDAPPPAAEPSPERGTEEGAASGERMDGLETAYFDAAEYAAESTERIETTDAPIEDPHVAPLEGLETTMFDAHDAGLSVEDGDLGVEHEERSFDDGGYVDDAASYADEVPPRGLQGSDELDGDDIGDPLPLLTDLFDTTMPSEPREEVPAADFDTALETGVEEEPVADFAGDVTLATDGPTDGSTNGPTDVDAAATLDALDVERERKTERTASEAQAAGNDYIDLSELLSLDVEETTRFRIEELDPTGDEERDFEELLEQFKAKLLAHLPPDDAAAHYDLGLAFREMGLLDEAIMVFQIAARAGHMRLKIFEELGQCFLEKRQYTIAEKVLRRALTLEHADELELLGVYYHLGRACEALGHIEQARDAYERVLGMDINFQDASERLARL